MSAGAGQVICGTSFRTWMLKEVAPGMTCQTAKGERFVAVKFPAADL